MFIQETLKRIPEQVIPLYIAHTDERLFFHNLVHTVRMIDMVDKMKSHYHLDERNYFIVYTAAWLLDLEIIHAGAGSISIKETAFSEEFLKNAGVEPDMMEEIKKCLMATRMPQNPETLNEKILCDAQNFYLGSPNFPAYYKLKRRETEAFTQVKIKGAEWRAKTISSLQNHQYQTEYCQSALNKTKEENLQNLLLLNEEKHWQKQVNEAGIKKKKSIHAIMDQSRFLSKENISTDITSNPTEHLKALNENNKGKLLKTKRHLKGVETMFRYSSSNHMKLSVMADNKAFIMISVNSILISVAIGLVIGKFIMNPILLLPTILLVSVSVAAIIYSVLATRPGKMKGTFTRDEVENKTVDLLFFGSFFKMPLEEFEFGMQEMMDDSEFLYGSLIKDIYSQGRILGRKFRLLRISYNIFMYGTACTVLAYVISLLSNA